MAHKNQKIEKKKEYNSLAKRLIKRETVGTVKCYLRAVKPNQKDVFGVKKEDGMWYSTNGYKVSPVVYGAERYKSDRIYFYEVGANDGSYRKCTTREDAERRFAQLVEFEKKTNANPIKL